jgi:hypothetical protein
MRELDQWWRIGGLGAIVFVAFGIVGIVLQSDVPLPTDSAEDIRAYFADDGDQYMIGDVFWGLAFVLGFLPFVAAFTAYLGMAEGQPRPWSRLAFGFAIALIAMSAAMSIVGGGLAYSAAEFADDSLLKTSVDMVYYGETLISGFLAIGLALSASFVILRTGVLWRWLGWVGVAVALAGFVSVFAVFDDDPEGALGIVGFVVFLVFALWILAIGIALVRASAPPAASSMN